MSRSDGAVRVVEVLVRNARAEVLVVCNAGRWRLPIGSPGPGESTRAAGVRRVHGETGVRAALGHVIALRERLTDRQEHWTTFAGVGVTEEITLNDSDGEVTDARWVTVDEAARMIPDHPVGIRRLASVEGAPYVDLMRQSQQ